MFKKMNLIPVLFTPTAMRLLRFLARSPRKELYGREIAAKAGTSVGAANQYLRLFCEARILTRERRGKEFFYTLNIDSPVVTQFKILLNVLDVQPLIAAIGEKSKKIVLFGSCAKGTDTMESDVDLFIVTNEKKEVTAAISDFSKGFERKISTIAATSEEYVALEKKDAALYQQIGAGIELWRRKEHES